MSDKYFGVQFRSMHTAIHSVAVFTAMNQADDFFNFIKNTEEMPTGDELNTSSLEAIYEINSRDVPDVYPFGNYEDGAPLEMCNVPCNTIPDVYGY